jgi:hypothetical protein
VSSRCDELKRLADTFDAMLARLDAAFATQRDFVANASHDLRKPLTLMRTAIDVMLAKPNRTTKQLEAMAVDVRRSARSDTRARPGAADRGRCPTSSEQQPRASARPDSGSYPGRGMAAATRVPPSGGLST